MTIPRAGPHKGLPDVWPLIHCHATSPQRHRPVGMTCPQQARPGLLQEDELGFPLMTVFELFQAVQHPQRFGRRGIRAIIGQRSQFVGVTLDQLLGACALWMRRTQSVADRMTFTFADARQSDLLTNGRTWQLWTATTLQWGIVSFWPPWSPRCARRQAIHAGVLLCPWSGHGDRGGGRCRCCGTTAAVELRRHMT